MDRSQITVYINGGQELLSAYAGLTREQLLAVPVPGTWSLQQIAIHMYDSDAIGVDRMKRIAAMEKPLLIGYDETAFSNLPGLDELDALAACQMFATNRKMLGVILSALPDSAFDRIGIHNEIGAISLEKMLNKYIDHLNGHLAHVRKKRSLVS